MRPREVTPVSRPTVFVHLPYGYDVKSWGDRCNQGLVQDKTPYGFHHAEEEGLAMGYSFDHGEGLIGNLIRRVIKKLLGFDVVHAWRNRREIEASDVVWTYSEREHLAIALLLLLGGAGKRRPKLVAQSIWLFDALPSMPVFYRKFVVSLLKQADLLTTLCADNLRLIRQAVPDLPSQVIYFGVSLDSYRIKPPPGPRPPHKPLRIFSAGTDIMRDWPTVIDAFKDNPAFEVRLACNDLSPDIVRGIDNIDVINGSVMRDMVTHFEWADILVLAVKPNTRICGISVMLEGVTAGVPVIATGAGGLDEYFPEGVVRYVRPFDSEGLRNAACDLAKDDDLRYTMANRAQKILVERDFSTKGYVKRYSDLTKSLLADGSVGPLPTAIPTN